MDEATLAAELLADKFSTHTQAQAQALTLTQTHTQTQTQTQALALAQAPRSHPQDAPSQISTAAPVYSSATNVAYPHSQTTSTNLAAAQPGDISTEPVQAYAKLEGDSFCYYIRTLQVTFGRKASSSDHVDIHLGPTKAISRQHARLFYNFSTQRFEIMVFGKNGAFVNEQFVEKGVTVPLENRTKIQIGEVSFSFLLPKLDTDEASQDSSGAQGSSQRIDGAGSASAGFGAYSGSNNMAGAREMSDTSAEPFDSAEYSSRDTKPPFSYASLIAQAINSSPVRKLTLNGIYNHITTHYPYYQMTQNGWQNSIRHNLSLNKAFIKVPRLDSEPGKGAFWTIDQSCVSQFSNGVYKRNRRAVSSKPGGLLTRSDSESPYDQSDRPRKRINTGEDSGTANSSPLQAGLTTQAQPTQSHQLQPTQGSTALGASSIITDANPLQQAPGLTAENLAALTQTITAAAKEGNQAALASALIAAANASGIPGGLSASLPVTARALAAHLQQQQQLQQKQPAFPASAPSQASSSTTALSTQLLSNLQAVSVSASRSTTSAAAASSPSTPAHSSPALSIPTPSLSGSLLPPTSTPSASTTETSASPSAPISAIHSTTATGTTSASTTSTTMSPSLSAPSPSSSAPADASVRQSPIAQLVAAAQAQARAQALAQLQQQQQQQQQMTQTSASPQPPLMTPPSPKVSSPPPSQAPLPTTAVAQQPEADAAATPTMS